MNNKLYSTTSSDIHMGGGLINMVCGDTINGTKMLLEALKNDINAVLYIVKYLRQTNVSIDTSLYDTKKKNVLHYLAEKSANNESLKIAIQIVLSMDVKGINAQDCDGNTPAHLALEQQSHSIVELLEKYGANLSITNKKGIKIIPDFQQVSVAELQESENREGLEEPEDNAVKFQKLTDNDTKLSNIIEEYARRQQNVANSTIIDFDQQTDLPNKPAQQGIDVAQINTDTVDSVSLLRNVLNRFNPQYQQGGSQSNGTRKISSYSEVSPHYGGSAYESEDDSEVNNVVRMGLMSREQSSEQLQKKEESANAHKQAIEKIKQILNVDQITARAYKAIIYSKIGEENKEMQNYDKAMELLVKASDSTYLSDISEKEVKRMVKIIQEKDELRSANTSLSESEKTEKKKAASKKDKKDSKTKDKKDSKTKDKKDSKTKDKKDSKTKDTK
jgi:hypothetical protein